MPSPFDKKKKNGMTWHVKRFTFHSFATICMTKTPHKTFAVQYEI